MQASEVEVIRGALADDAARLIRRITDAIVAVIRDDVGQPHVFAVRLDASGARALDVDGQWVPVVADGHKVDVVLNRCIHDWSEGEWSLDDAECVALV